MKNIPLLAKFGKIKKKEKKIEKSLKGIYTYFMDFQALVDAQGMASAVLSVEKTDDGHYGDIRIVRANKMYRQIMGVCAIFSTFAADFVKKS